MKLFAMLVLFVFSTLGLSAPSKGTGPNMFVGKTSCKTALSLGDYTYYEPKYFNNKDRDPVDGVNTKVMPLEREWCYEMETVSGKKWVVQKVGTLFRFKKNADGTFTPYARDDCGNTIYSVAEEDPTPVEKPKVAEIPPPPKGSPPPAPPGVETAVYQPPRPVGPPIRISIPRVEYVPVPVYQAVYPAYPAYYGYGPSFSFTSISGGHGHGFHPRVVNTSPPPVVTGGGGVRSVNTR